jgi:hypothetical protein
MYSTIHYSTDLIKLNKLEVAHDYKNVIYTLLSVYSEY